MQKTLNLMDAKFNGFTVYHVNENNCSLPLVWLYLEGTFAWMLYLPEL